MAQVYKCTGKIGVGPQENTLGRASAIMLDTLEAYGHAPGSFSARESDALQADCGAYRARLRLQDEGSGTSWLQITLSPLLPGDCQQEESEALLAELMRRLVADLGGTTVYWMDAPAPLPAKAFLAVFARSEAAARKPASAAGADPAADTTVLESGSALSARERAKRASSARRTSNKTTERPHGRAVFAPVEETAAELQAHCDEMLSKGLPELKSHVPAPKRETPAPGATPLGAALNRLMRGAQRVGLL